MRQVGAARWSVLGLVAVLVVAVAMVPSSAGPDPHERVLVLGDSMTAQFTDDPGDPMQGWWSILGERHGWEMVTSAQGGGGLIKKGAGCYGTAVRERSSAVIARVRPTRIIVAVGYNDVNVCTRDGRGTKINAGFRDRAAAAAFERIGEAAEAVGMRRSDVIVTVPWGTLRLSDRSGVVLGYAAGARAAGLRFVNVRRFQRPETLDATHPNRTGATLVADALESTVQAMLRSSPAGRSGRPAPDPSPTADPSPTPPVSPEVELTPEIVPTPATP